MPHKKKAFTKGNSEKFLLLQGNPQAVNADGETLKNVLVPVSKNYKPGTSLLMSNIAAISNLELEENKDNDFEGLFDDASTIDGSDTEIETFNFSRIPKEFSSFDYNNQENDSEQDYPRKDPDYPETSKMFDEILNKLLEDEDEDDDDMIDLPTSPKPFRHDLIENEELELNLGDCDEDIKEKVLNYAEDSSDEKIVEIVTEKPLEFDCESILSTYSNKYNHPTVIKEDRIQKIKISHSSNESKSDNESQRLLPNTTCNVRKKGETPEERKERQKMFKEAKKFRRELKKQTKEAFKEEKKSQALKDQHNGGIKLLFKKESQRLPKLTTSLADYSFAVITAHQNEINAGKMASSKPYSKEANVYLVLMTWVIVQLFT